MLSFLSGITYLWTNEGWLYVAIVLDLFNREAVGWSLKTKNQGNLTNANAGK
ncbi:MAG: hypothetical protein J0I60_05285 [Nitrosospira sp.]|nr:hypothetical protein [Nitrosospira sp.]